MRYMMFIRHPSDYDPTAVPPALFGAMDEFMKEYAQKGVFIEGAGLAPLSKATRVSLSGGKISVRDGPFAESKEVVGGYAICEFASHEEAVELATKFMELHRVHWPGFEGESEIRPIEG